MQPLKSQPQWEIWALLAFGNLQILGTFLEFQLLADARERFDPGGGWCFTACVDTGRLHVQIHSFNLYVNKDKR